MVANAIAIRTAGRRTGVAGRRWAMTELPDGFEVSGVYVYCSEEDPETFYFLPGNPGPERSPSGEPMLTLVVTDQNAMLQLGTQWKVESSVLDSLSKVIADRFPDLNPALIRFTPAPLSIESVSLMLTNANG